MALTYTNFTAYPTEIEGIDADYNATITAIETFVKNDMAAVGVTVSDAILVYFVFWFFCQDASGSVAAKTGETSPIMKNAYPDFVKQVRAWNTGVEKLRVLCGITPEMIKEVRNSFNGYFCETDIIDFLVTDLGISINQTYLSKRSAI